MCGAGALMSITDDLLKVIHQSAAAIPTFNDRLGPGVNAGNGATRKFVKTVNHAVSERWPEQVEIDRTALSGAKLDFDFYIPSEKTAVEIALSIRNPVSEYEKDIFKGLLARESGLPLERLILIGKSGSVKTRNMPGSKAIRDWAWDKHKLKVEVHEIAAGASDAMADEPPDAAD
jgi:hypothetical protein